MTYVLGIDPSLTGTGLALLDKGGRLLESTVVKPGDRREAERLGFIADALGYFALPTAPELLAVIEGYAFGSPYGREALGELGGVIRLQLHRLKVPYLVVAPLSWRSQLLGKSVKKDMVGVRLLERYAAEIGPTETLASLDILEAWAVGYAGLQRHLGVFQPKPVRARRSKAADPSSHLYDS